MRKIFVAVVCAAVVLLGASPVGAAPRSVSASTSVSDPNVIVGTYSWNAGGGQRVTVGFVPCGHSYPWTDENGDPVVVLDPLAQYHAKVRKGGGWTTEVWAHSPGSLNNALVSYFGFGLTAEAFAVLAEDAATYTCTG